MSDSKLVEVMNVGKAKYDWGAKEDGTERSMGKKKERDRTGSE